MPQGAALPVAADPGAVSEPPAAPGRAMPGTGARAVGCSTAARGAGVLGRPAESPPLGGWETVGAKLSEGGREERREAGREGGAGRGGGDAAEALPGVGAVSLSARRETRGRVSCL